MAGISESSYRACRRAFIAACEARHVESVARVHPARDRNGRPLFMDCAALGPRLAIRAVLAIASDAAGSAIAVALLEKGLALPEDGRLVLVHALDPAAFAGVKIDAAWPGDMLKAVGREDLSRVRDLAVLPLARELGNIEPALAAPQASIRALPTVGGLAEAEAAIAGFFGG